MAQGVSRDDGHPGVGLAGERGTVVSADGTRIGLLTAGTGPALLLVHGGMGSIARWAPMWPGLTRRWRVTAMDRRGRGTSEPGEPYALARESEDIASVAAWLADQQGAPVDVFAHSYGATCALGAAAPGMTRAPDGSGAQDGTEVPGGTGALGETGALGGTGAAGETGVPGGTGVLDGNAVGRMVLYEPAGPATLPGGWLDRVTGMIDAGQAGRAMVSFLVEVVGLTRGQIEALRDAPGGADVLPIAAATMPREGRAIAGADLAGLAAGVTGPVRLLLGELSPPWAGQISRELAGLLPDVTLTLLPGQGHEAIDTAPGLLLTELARFLATG